MRRRLSIRCAFAFQSIETFFALLAWFFGPKGNLDAKVMAVSMIGRASVDKVMSACPPWHGEPTGHIKHPIVDTLAVDLEGESIQVFSRIESFRVNQGLLES